MSRFDISTLLAYKLHHKLTRRTHPTYPLWIWNYTDTCQYKKQWDDITLQCRCLVTDAEGTVISRSFPKFFNDGEKRHDATPEFTVTEKMDGSLGMLFFYNPTQEWIMTSRGSFDSTQSDRARDILKKKYTTEYLEKDKSYIFEIIYPENRIVVDYRDREELVFLASFCPDGKENVDQAENVRKCGFPIVKTYEPTGDYTTILELFKDEKNMEGVVVRFSNGQRIKMKLDHYIHLHRNKSNLTVPVIWSWYRENNLPLDQVPDEFHEWVSATWASFDTKFAAIETEAREHFRTICNLDRKSFAQAVNHHPLKHILFALYDKKDDDVYRLVCDRFRPKGAAASKETAMITSQGEKKKKEKDGPWTPPTNLKLKDLPGKIILTIGIPGSGKSTWTRQYISENPSTTVSVGRDDLRLMLYKHNDDSYYQHALVREREDRVTQYQNVLIHEALKKGLTVIVDNTNIEIKYINAFKKEFSSYRIEFQRFDITIQQAILNDQDPHRARRVGEQIIRKYYNRLVTLKQKFTFAPYIPTDAGYGRIVCDANLPPCYITDIDGTTAQMHSRGPFEWDKVGEDLPRHTVINCLKALKASGFAIIACTGRDGICQEQTKAWLVKHGVPFDEFHSRDTGDNKTKDYVVKHRMWSDISTRYNIIALFDDRNQVVEHGRRVGLQVFQVAEGNF